MSAENLNTPLVVGWDLDDTLFDAETPFRAHAKEAWGITVSSYDYHAFGEDWCAMLGLTPEQVEQFTDTLHAQVSVLDYKPIDGVPELLNDLPQFTHKAITSRCAALREDTSISVVQHYPAIQEIVYAGCWDGPESDAVKLRRTKAVVAQESGVDILVDNQLKHCLSAASIGIGAVLLRYQGVMVPPNLPKTLDVAQSCDDIREILKNAASRR